MNYRPVSRFAVAAVLIAPLATLGVFFPGALVSAVFAIGCAIAGLKEIYKYGLAGRGIAITGLMTSLICLTALPAWHYVSFHSESLPGYRREDFGDLVQHHKLDSLEGADVCFKGYAVIRYWSRPPTQTFLLSPDGDKNSDIDSVRVHLTRDQEWVPTWNGVAVSGYLVRNEAWTKGGDEPRFVLKNALLVRSRSSFQIGLRKGHGC